MRRNNMSYDDEIKIDGLDEIDAQNTPVDELETEDVNLFFLGIDESSSMTPYQASMIKQLDAFKRAIVNSKEAPKILLARANFSDKVDIGGYKKIDEMDTSYRVINMTILYDTIIAGTDALLRYMDYLKQQGVRVKAVFAIFSDGADTASMHTCHVAKDYIDKLNAKEIVTAFVSFGQDGMREANDLGFKNVLEVGRTDSELRRAFNTLSKSAISNSKSVVSKTADFFEQ